MYLLLFTKFIILDINHHCIIALGGSIVIINLYLYLVMLVAVGINKFTI